MGSLQLKTIRKAFGSHEVLKGIDLDVKDGEFVIFVGPSAAESRRFCALSPALRTRRRAAFKSTVVESAMWRRPSAASPWCFSPTRSIRT